MYALFIVIVILIFVLWILIAPLFTAIGDFVYKLIQRVKGEKHKCQEEE